MRKALIVLLFLAWKGSGFASGHQRQEVNLAEYSEYFNDKDITLALNKAVNYCKEIKASKLIIPHGRYEVSSEYALERYVWVSNNDEGLKRFAFDLTEMEDFEIDGEGSLLLFHGFVSPFLILDSKRIKVRNLSIDYARTFHSEGRITNARSDGIDVTFSEDFPYKIEQNMLFFYDAQGRCYPYSNLLEFDLEKRETAFMAKDYWLQHPLVARELREGEVRIYKEGLTGSEGNILVFGAANRDVPGFIISDSKEITISRVNIYHCGGMGIIAQRSRDIALSEVIVSHAPGSGRVVSITADATHFVQCSGYIHIINCLFEQQKDDATNIHGVYAAIVQILSPTEVVLKWKHPQQYGFLLGKLNDPVEIVASQSLITLGENRIKNIEVINKEFFKIEFEEEIPQDVQLNDVIASTGHAPDVLIKGSIFRGNRARGLLLGSRGKIVIEENYFHVPGAAILFEGDGNYWYEQSGVRNVLIRNNIFDDCNYGVWGNALFQVGSGIYENKEQSRYHRNIVIEENNIRVFDPRLVNIYSVDGFVFRKNQIKETATYPNLFHGADPFVVDHCDGVVIK